VVELDRRCIGVLGTGSYIPQKLMENTEVEKICGLEHGVIEEKTGIKKRYIANEEESASFMAYKAALEAIDAAGITVEQVDLIVCCTFTADYVYPALSCKVQQLLRAKNAGCFDLMANCTGYQVGLSVAGDKMKCDNSIKYSLVIGVAKQSCYIDWTNPDTAMYFGDGAGASILGEVPKGHGIIASELITNSNVYESVRLRGGGSNHPLRSENVNDGLQYYELNGLEVWKQVMQFQPTVIKKLLKKMNKSLSDVDFIVFHQANKKLIEFLMARMRLPLTKTIMNIEEIGNTADASLAIALHTAVTQDKLKSGDLVIVSGVGAGFTFGATAITWH
jgi:3-oxoacyl-[acyl-carrier-protein] synthase-3